GGTGRHPRHELERVAPGLPEDVRRGDGPPGERPVLQGGGRRPGDRLGLAPRPGGRPRRPPVVGAEPLEQRRDAPAIPRPSSPTGGTFFVAAAARTGHYRVRSPSRTPRPRCPRPPCPPSSAGSPGSRPAPPASPTPRCCGGSPP